MTLLLGAIADDYTGATDLANILVREGMRVTQVLGLPDDPTVLEDADAVIVALKTRTCPTHEAVSQSLAALKWLKQNGAEQVLFKYCSTFDSTPSGNIGPVADALMAALECKVGIVCPAFPENGRTVVHGHLFVNGTLLAESPMKDHPLTPMRDSNLVRLMADQSEHPVSLIDLNVVRAGAKAIASALSEIDAAEPTYLVVDAVNSADIVEIGRAAADLKLITGGSAVATALPENFRIKGRLGPPSQIVMPRARGRVVVLAGSCSAATRAQLKQARADWPTRQLDVDALALGHQETLDLVGWALQQRADQPVVIFSSADPDDVKQTQEKYGSQKAGEMVEQALGSIAARLAENGFDRIIVAGGETSGAVSQALRVKSLRIGPEIAPGVPWTEADGTTPLALALKSGNFGGADFFHKAVAMFDA